MEENLKQKNTVQRKIMGKGLNDTQRRAQYI